MRIRLMIEYDGTRFCGWQRQNNGMSVQARIEEAVENVTGKKSIVHGSGRTDAGVHAMGQVAHFDTDSMLSPERFAFALNYHLPPDIRILASQEVGMDFHARYSARRKTYRYIYRNAPQRSALFRGLSSHEPHPLDEKAMDQAATYFVGTHDFRSFCAHPGDKDTVRTIEDISVQRNGDYITLEITGNGFLHNMVRIIAGTLAEVGKGAISPEKIPEILDAKDRRRAGPTAPAQGLFLVRVDYDDEYAKS